MEDINEYILRSITERKAHLDLETRCIERGGAAGKGRTLTEEHKRKISENRKGGRKKSTARVV